MKNQLAESVGLGSTEKIVLIRGRALENFSNDIVQYKPYGLFSLCHIISRKTNILTSDMHTYVCISGGRKYLFLEKFCVRTK